MIWKKLFFFTLMFTGTCTATAQTEELIRTYEQRAEQWLVKHESIEDHFRITKEGIIMYADAAKKFAHDAEFFLPWEDVSFFESMLENHPEQAWSKYQRYTNPDVPVPPLNIATETTGFFNESTEHAPLRHKRIAVCPGHFATTYREAQLEGKWISLSPEKEGDDSLRFYESELTKNVGRELTQNLEELGAEVLNIRSHPSGNALEMTFNTWLQQRFSPQLKEDLAAEKITTKEYEWWSTKADSGYILRHYFAPLERQARIEKINNFNPDLTLIIHFNVDASNKPWTTPTDKNCNMIFIPGAFMKNELNTAWDRYRFLALLISDQVPESMKASTHMIQAFSALIKGKPAKTEDATYLATSCIPASTTGVFHRNLELTRELTSPLVYGETFYQDNLEIATMFDESSWAVVSVVEAYLTGVLAYFQQP